MARIHFLIDPIDPRIGQVWPRDQVEIEKRLQDYEFHIIRGRLHAESLVRKLASSSVQLIVCVGGDRLLHEVVNALEARELFEKKPKICLYPKLHGDNFIRNIRSRSSFLDFLDDFLAGRAQEEEMDLVEVTYRGEYGQEITRVFVCGAAFGFATRVLPELSEPGHSRLSLLRRTWRGLAFYKPQILRLQFEEEESREESLLTGFIQNIPHLAGGLKISPSSDPRDGKVEVYGIRRSRFFQYLLLLFRFYGTGLKEHSSILYRSVNRFRVEPKSRSTRIGVEMDHDIRGYLPLELRVKRRALCLLH